MAGQASGRVRARAERDAMLVQRAQEMRTYEAELAAGAAFFAGVDEVGRGCLAGPVVAAAVVLDGPAERWQGIADSKLLTRPARTRMAERIMRDACWAMGMASVAEIEQYNILHAARLAMARAVTALSKQPPLVLVDGQHTPWFVDPAEHVPSVPVTDGDALCLSIAAASIVAKVERDKMMAEWDAQYPQYGFARNAGYGTPEHLAALRRYGPCPLHRVSFAPVRRVLSGEV